MGIGADTLSDFIHDNRQSPLTGREADALAAAAAAAAQGAPISEIAVRLYLSEGTVRNYLSAAISKTGARTRAEAVRLATDRGWL